ncbi:MULTISPECIES: DUF4845 domain-containing protein [Uliginosibacterium]|uniref:DUF4845 domain-containing protein n=1 Tax=Uliginosibacterium aquaticum TaxID=2731212 RepID=A0ABX2IK24_9RHOO|nr:MULTISPECIES: DUF4845 domain-containing protein [Uliginosibacterium]MDO6388257.1 DUF4845 domain-containing protein [Uliginosibacterium sp. 31-12]NSL56662.1 DUF4845 domain-containing protein [Uliginosibacterium aquaticum]PLK47343.1 hypothetical protein C0V76_16945 [Uliginosibacterium sp. TH139]
MKKQQGMTLISLAIVGTLIAACLVVGLKLVPVFSEYFAVQKAFNKVVATVDPAAPPSNFRTAFARFTEVDAIRSVDPQTVVVDKNNGKVSLQVSYRREVPLVANVGLYLDFDVSSN